MAWTIGRKAFGTCGNFKFEIFNLTDVKATRSLIKPRMGRVDFVSSTNTTDNADVLAGQTLSWSGTADGNTANKLVDSSEAFDPAIDGAQAHNTADNLTSFVTYDKDNTDALFCHKGGSDDSIALNDGDGTSTAQTGDAAFDLAPDGNETFTIDSQRIVQVTAASANDEGTVIIFGGG